MAKAERPYARVYLDAPDDPKFTEVWADDAALALWLRLLVGGEASYPLPAVLPYRAKRAPLTKLAKVGLVDLVGLDRYRIHGLQAERERRAEAGRTGGIASGLARGGSLNGGGTTVPRGLDQNKDETKDEDENENEGTPQPPGTTLDLLDGEDDILDVWYRLTASPPSPKLTPWLERLAAEYGTEATATALGVEWSANPDRSTVMGRTQALLWRRAHEGEKRAKREEEDRRLQATAARRDEDRRREEAMTPEQRAANMARLRDQLAERGIIPGSGRES
jgi:hypothetical protein